MLIMRVSDPTFDERLPDNRVVVRFRVNQQPDQTWIQTFKGHAASSVLRAANAVFRGHDVTLELTRPKNLAELSTAGLLHRVREPRAALLGRGRAKSGGAGSRWAPRARPARPGAVIPENHTGPSGTLMSAH